MKMLGDISISEKLRELSLAGTGQFFVMSWTCLSLVVVRNFLDQGIMSDDRAEWADMFAKNDDSGNDNAPGTQKIDETIWKASDYIYQLSYALYQTEDLAEVEEILRSRESWISELEQINREADSLMQVDSRIYRDNQRTILSDHNFHRIISQFPGVLDNFADFYPMPLPFNRLVELFHDTRKMQFINPAQVLKSLCYPVATLRNILEGQGDADAYKELLKSLNDFISPLWTRWNGNEMQRLSWRMQDLRDGGGLGFTVELFFLALDQLLSTS